jgi:GAF domain-containing protein
MGPTAAEGTDTGALPEDSPWPTLHEVIGSLDPDVLRIARAGGRGTVRIRDVVIHDPADPQSIQADAVALAVGVSAEERDAVALVETAGRCGAPALVFRCDGELPAPLSAAADELGVALLTVPPEMPWGQLYSLLRTATASGGPIEHGDAAGIPVGDLFALADAIAAAVGAPVTIEDLHWRVLAYSNLDHPIDDARRQTILGRTPPGLWQQRLEDAGITRALRGGERIVRFEADGLAPRLCAAVSAGGELLGTIWVAQGNAPLGAEAEDELVRAAELAAIHLVSHRASEDIKRRTRGAFVRELLEGRVPATSLSATVPLKTEGPFTVLLFDMVGADGPSRGGMGERILSIISLYCEDEHPDAMCALVDDRFWSLLPTSRNGADERAVGLARKIAERVERSLHVRLRVAIGASVPSVADVPRSRRAAEQALKVMIDRQPAGQVVRIDDVRAHAVLLELLDVAAEHSNFQQGKLDALIDHDAARGTSYVPTLRAYLDAACDTGRAAAEIGVHVNTLRYRLKRLVELSGLRLDDPDERLVTELQLRMHAHGS